MSVQVPEKIVDKKGFLLSLKSEDITFDLLIQIFANKAKRVKGPGKKTKIDIKEAKIPTNYKFTLEKGEYFNTEKIETNAGLFIYNKLIVERELKDVLGYINTPVDGKMLGKIEDKLSKALLNDNITVHDMVNYLNRTQWLGMQMHAVVSGSFTMNTLKPLPKVVKERERLLKENREKIDNKDVITAVKIEQQLLDIAEKELVNDHGMYLYRSGARGSFSNNFKNSSIIKGPVFNPTTGNFDIVESNYMEGIRKEELAVYGNAIITAAYPKAIGTATSGYFSKQIIAALQAVVLDKKGSDCGTKGTQTIRIDKNNSDDFRYRYIKEGSKLVLLDDNTLPKYIGKEVKMRSPMYCIGKKLCRTCAGTMYEKLNIENIGLTAARVSSTLLNLSMKKFHNSTAQLTNIDINDIVI